MFKRNTITALALTSLLLGLQANLAPAQSQAQKIDFHVLLRLAQLSNLAYEPKSEIRQVLAKYLPSVSNPGETNVQYIIGYNDKTKTQAIGVRGTVDEVNKRLNQNTAMVLDKKSGIMMHQGFRTAALTIYKDLKPKLKPGYRTYLTGHSLGGAVAAILTTYLHVDGVKIAGLYTYGQPKFTNVAGAKKFRGLPVLRAIYQNDVVPLVPNETDDGKSSYRHMGPEVILLQGPHFVYLKEDRAIRKSRLSLGKRPLSFPDHRLARYIDNLNVKQKGAKEVPFKDREKFVKRQRPAGYQQEEIKSKSNLTPNKATQ